MFDRLRRLRRSFRVMRTGAVIYLRYKRTQRRASRLPPEAAEAEWERRHEQTAEALYRLAVGLKGLYIKTGQFIGTRADVAPAAYVRSLSRLQDRVPPRPFADVRKTVEAELGRPLEDLFAHMEETPLAAASLAQVHRARLRDGSQVVVKVQYPEVESLVRLDLRNMRAIVGFIARREPDFDYRAIVDELANQVPLELDFVREAEMTERVRKNLAAIPGLQVPEVVEGMVSRKVLVTRYLEGVRLDSAEFASWQVDGVAVAQRISDAYAHQIMVDGLFQADPHPGNILLRADGGVALLDFGLTKELPLPVRLGFARLIIAAAERDLPAVAAALEELGVRVRGGDATGALMLIDLFFGDHGDLGQGGSAFGNLRRMREETGRRAPVDEIPVDLVLLGRVTGLLRGVCHSLGATLNPTVMLRPYAERALAEAEAGEASARPA